MHEAAGQRMGSAHRRRAALSLQVLVLSAVLAGCGGSDSPDGERPPGRTTRSTGAARTMLNTGKVASAIAASVQRQRHVTAKVRCPQAVPQAKGVNFVCRATSKFGVTVFAVIQRDAAGRVSYIAADDSR